ncbi:MAG: PAS domain-containing protein [Candidatus Delongbacteria bacterium]|nr:PAS domain-containing protein [Candidatus Delongbacteria bacterium]
MNDDTLSKVLNLESKLKILEIENQTLIKENKHLQQKEVKYRKMLESIGDHVSLIDKNYNIVWANKIAKSIYGKDIIGKKCHQVYHNSDKPCEPYPCLTMKTLQDGKVHKHESTSFDKKGNKIYLNCSANVAVFDERGKPLEAIEVSSNITQQKLAEKERDKLIKELKEAIDKINVLNDLLPICAKCKNIRDDKGYWYKVEEYFDKHTETKFSHSICPDCKKELYGDLKAKLKD